MVWQTTRDLELVARVLPGDDLLIARAVRAASKPRRQRRWYWRTAMAAGLTFALGGVSVAGMMLMRRDLWLPEPVVTKSVSHESLPHRRSAMARPPETLLTPKAPPAAIPPAGRARSAAAPTTLPALSRLVRTLAVRQELTVEAKPETTIALPATVPAAQQPVEHRTAVAAVESLPASVSGSVSLVATETAQDLLVQANTKRRAGDLQAAVPHYRRLQERFPGTAEAAVSYVSLGQILNKQGDVKGALVSYEAYLARVPAGALIEEALHGRALALGGLGRERENDEQKAWRELLGRFPKSVYASHARSRLRGP
jgi:TolA-binding protein